MKLIEKIDFGKGKIVRDNFINLDVPLCNQEMDLTEDMFQITYNNFVLDLGWTPEIDCNGHFNVYLIKDHDWDNPIICHKPRTIEDLLSSVKECLKALERE